MSANGQTEGRPAGLDPKVLRYFVPFYFTCGSGEAVQAFEAGEFPGSGGKKAWTPCTYPLNATPDIYRQIQTMMRVTEHGDGVCRSFRYNINHLALQKAKQEEPDKAKKKSLPPLTWNGLRGQTVPFDLTNVYVHLFSSGIGLLVYDAVPAGLSGPDELAGFQCGFKELCHSDKTISFTSLFSRVPVDSAEAAQAALEAAKNSPPAGLPEGSVPDFRYNEKGRQVEIRYRITCRLGDLLHWILHSSCADIAYFSASGSGLPDKAVLMSYVVFTDGPADLRAAACHLARGYDAKYRISRDDLAACQTLFDNVVCCASFEGCCIAVRPDEDNRSFFVNNPPYGVYAFIFLLTLYQHYSLLRFSDRMTNGFPSDPDLYLTGASYADDMQRLITQINTHLMKSDFSTVSHIRSHNLFYDYCKKALRIPEDTQGLTSGFDYLVRLQADQRRAQIAEIREREMERQKEEADLREARAEHLNQLVSILTCVTFLGDAYAIADLIFSKLQEGFASSDFIRLGILAALLALSVLLFFAFRRRPRKKPKALNPPSRRLQAPPEAVSLPEDREKAGNPAWR